MAAQGMQGVIPYAVNFSVVVAFLAVVLRKPLKKYIYQRHEHMKDAVESATLAYRKAGDRHASAKSALERIAEEERGYLAKERLQNEREKKEILEKAKAEAQRLLREADRLSGVEQDEASERVKQQFLDLVVKETEESLRKGLKQADHSAIFKRAQTSIEVGV